MFSEKLRETFEGRGFKVDSRRNLTRDDMKTFIEETARADHTHYDCFVCCILTHGNDNIFAGVDCYVDKQTKQLQGTIDIKELTALFKAKTCPSLKCKPKLFFLQSCRGGKSMGFYEGSEEHDDVNNTISLNDVEKQVNYLLFR